MLIYIVSKDESMHHFGSHLFFIQLWRLVLIFPLPKNWEHEKCFTQGSFYVLSSLSHKLRQFLKLMPHYKIAPDWFSIFHICQVLQGLLLVKPCTWRKHCVSFSSLPTLHTKGFKNVLVLHIGLICKVKDIAIFSIPSSAFSWSLFLQFLGLEFIIQKDIGVIHNWPSTNLKFEILIVANFMQSYLH
jgi:hypothetical protein